MAKKKKTRQQKILADLRREGVNESLLSAQKSSVETILTKNVVISESAPIIVKPRQVVTHAIVADYNYIFADLRKTAIVTGVIVIAELILRFYLQRV